MCRVECLDELWMSVLSALLLAAAVILGKLEEGALGKNGFYMFVFIGKHLYTLSCFQLLM